jgi:hypothetical protein
VNQKEREMMFSKYGEFKGYDWDKRLYASRYWAKHYHPERVAVKVEGGYKSMTTQEYKEWRKQK